MNVSRQNVLNVH